MRLSLSFNDTTQGWDHPGWDHPGWDHAGWDHAGWDVAAAWDEFEQKSTSKSAFQPQSSEKPSNRQLDQTGPS